jgi:phytoene synthase
VSRRVAIPVDTDLQFCWQQVLRVRPGFRLSYTYAPKELWVRLLALYALLTAVEEALCRVSDEGVALAKLTWWQQQLLSPEYRVSAHPITRQLYRSGMITPDTQEHFRGLLASTMERLDAPAPTNENALKSLCRSVGLYPLRLELAMQDGNQEVSELFEEACAVNGLVQLLRESSRSEMPGYTWLPLNLLARYDLVRDAVQSKTRADKIQPLMEQLCAWGLSWTANRDLDLKLRISAELRKRHRHWIIQTRLNVRKLENLRHLSIQQHGREFMTARARDAWLAWRVAREISGGGARK